MSPPLDPRVFFLFAGVVACVMLMAMTNVGMCALYFADIVAGRFKCDPDDRIMRALDLIIAALLLTMGKQLLK